MVSEFSVKCLDVVVVVINEFTHDPMQMRLIKDNDLIEAFIANRANPSFCEGIGFWRLKGCLNDVYMFRIKNCIK